MGHGRNLALTKYPNNMRILKSVVAGENFGYPDKVPQQSTPRGTLRIPSSIYSSTVALDFTHFIPLLLPWATGDHTAGVEPPRRESG